MKVIFAILSVMFASTANSEPVDVQEVENIFVAEGVEGTLVVATGDGEIVAIHNVERAGTRFSPASTFKIPNTLIALDAGVVASKESPFKWDGEDRGVPAWNHDQTLQSAFRVSCVWCYQQIARQLGADRYRTALADIDYGNRGIGDQVDQFWLNGDLRISAVEQVAFLKKLYRRELPFLAAHEEVLKEIMLDEETSDYSLYAKSGWTGARLHVGWFVGFVEKDDRVWLFAMNMRMDNAAQAPQRKALTVRSLKALKIL